MVITYRSTIPERFEISNVDQHGRKRSVTATKFSDDFSWNLRLQHPSGKHWDATYAGRAGILDAMGELLTSRDVEFVQDRDRGDRPPAEAPDRNRRVFNDGTFAEPTIIPRR
jgi:hypothetical protein